MGLGERSSKAKEAAGDVTDNEELKAEVKAEQAKAKLKQAPTKRMAPSRNTDRERRGPARAHLTDPVSSGVLELLYFRTI